VADYGLMMKIYRCHPSYLTERAYAKLSKPHAFDGLRIHTDEIIEVLARLQSEALTIAVIMDSMDWFDIDGVEARKVRTIPHDISRAYPIARRY
jgi:S-adenosylmethionine:diacylglycerol 3-amino-3-carboxypropyl transferase